MKKKWTTATIIILCCLCLSPVWGESATERTLSFYNTHTHERLTVIYKNSDNYVSEAMDKIAKILIPCPLTYSQERCQRSPLLHFERYLL